MRLTARSKALAELRAIKDEFRVSLAVNYEHRAQSCSTCERPGACCLDTHFVNVRISQLESAAIKTVIDELASDHRDRVRRRVASTRMEGEHFACPLFERGVGCLVHEKAKPLACIAHACYEKQEDLPPESLLTEREGLIEKLNLRTYGSSKPWLPIPDALRKII